nr:autophagy-related protein 2 homolog B isoform X1 [Onthophagus taurus]
METLKSFSLTKTFKKKVFMYLLHRYLGQFIEEKLRLDQLELHLDMHNGIGTVEYVSLDVQQINNLGEAQNWPMEIVDGYIEKITVTVPWSSILKEPTIVVINGLKLTVQPKQRTDYATSMFESMWSSMSSSRQLAQECMQESPNLANNKTLDGIENFAQTIDSILSRVKVTFIDTVIQIEHVPKHSISGVGIQIKIDHIRLYDEAGNDPPTGETPDANVKEQSKAYVDSLVTCKNFILTGVSFHTIEFPTKARTFSKSVRERSPCKHCQASDLTESDEDERCNCSLEDQEETGRKVNTDRHVIMFAKLNGVQEIRVRIKQPELVVGPKVSIEAMFGTFTVFMSPRQLFVLVELVNGLTSPDLEDTSNLPPKHKCTEKPMTSADFERIEQELQNQIHPLNINQGKGLQGPGHGWSASPQDDDDSIFFPLRGKTNTSMFDSTTSNASSSMESSLTSSLTSSASEISSARRRKSHNIEADPTAEISHFQIRVASISVLLLHEDILAVSPDNLRIIPASVVQMQNISKTFFAEHPYQNGYGAKDLDKVSKEYDEKLPNMNHLRLLAAPVHIEAKETTTNTAFSVNGKLTMAKVELIESVTNGQEKLNIVRLLSFHSGNPLESPTNSKPQLSLNFKHIEKTGKPGNLHLSAPKTEIEIALDTCSIELDITLIDRLRALLDPTPVCVIDKEGKDIWRIPSTTSLISHSESKLDIKMSSPSISVKLRFPIPDLRAHSDPNRVPWYKRNVRLDYLTLQISDATLFTSIQTSQIFQKYTLDFRVLDILYHENELVSPLAVARVESDQKLMESLGYNGITAFPQLILKINPIKNSDIELHHIPEAEFDTMCQSIYGNLMGEHKKEPSPFSSKREIHESDNPHMKTQAETPGDKQEMEDFVNNTLSNSLIELEMHLPVVSLQLLTKHIYEVIYNRINSDLLLWEPSAPRNCNTYTNDNIIPNFTTHETDTFGMCKSNINYGSESESDEESDPTQIYYSAYERSMRTPRQTCKDVVRQSQFALNLHIKLGLVGMNTPVRDLHSNVIPNQQGEFVFQLHDMTIFNVSGYNGDNNLGYVCATARKAEMYHCDMRSIPSQSPALLEIDSILGKHLYPTIYKSDNGVQQECTNRGGKRDMLSVAVKVQANHETHQVKTITVAIGIDKATLKHRMCLEPNTWITQLIDFFNVIDYTITGYNAKEVLTELHLHLWDCAIDYRPKFLPLRSVITLGSFSLSCHLAAQSCSSTLRFLAEDCGLFLSEKAPPRNGKPSEAAIDLRRDYVNVVQLGLFEISLKLHDEKSGIFPLVDLRAANNILHIRTCADSGRALMQLITYLAAYGDTVKNDDTLIPCSSPSHQPEPQLVPIEPTIISKLSDSQHEQINKEICEAMEDVDERLEQQNISDVQGTGAKLFFFPDEKNRTTLDSNFTLVKSEKGDVIPLRTNLSSDTDDEFCFIDLVGTSNTSNYSAPEINWKTEVPVRLVDRHFNKPGKIDFLKTPNSYPQPVTRYTLRELTLTWDMYGGNDFKINEKEVQKKTVNFADTATVNFSNTPAGEVVFTKAENKKKQKVGWPLCGGVNRDQNVLMQLHLNKVRFQHDLYPDHTTQASRQVLLITEIEVKDKLACSEINKFLYEYSTEENPKRSHSHMLSVKAIHTRPDPAFKTEECELKISMLPLRLNIDQDSFLFLVNFFSEMTSLPEDSVEIQIPSKHSTPTHQPPVISKSRNDQKTSETSDINEQDQDLLSLNEENPAKEESLTTNVVPDDCIQDSSPIFFKSVMFSPEVSIRIDYHGKRVDMSHGPLPGLLMGIGHLNCSIIKLKELINSRGILGMDNLFQFLWSKWLEDIKKNQIPGVLGGIGPMHALLQLVQGIWDLFWMPIEQYQKDGRIVRGIQRGANSFTKSTLVATLELASRIIHLVLITAETAFDMLSSGKSIKRLRYNQPQDLREGVSYAYNVVREGFGEAASNLVHVASHEHEQKGYTGAVGGILRQIPPTIIQPIIIASNATNNVLGGMRCQLAPDIRQEVIDKWKKDESKK